MRLFWRFPWDLTASFMRVGKNASTWSFCATYKAIALVGTAQILSEYWNNRNLLMSKNESLFQKSKRALFSSLTIFYCFDIHALFWRVPWDLTANFMRVGKNATTWSFCATNKAIALVGTAQILSEYWNNRNLLMSKNESLFQKSKRALFSSLTIFYCFDIHAFILRVPWDLTANFMRVGKNANTWSFCATYKAIALVGTAQILSEFWNNRNLLMSKNESLFQKSKRALFSSLTIFYCFNIHAFILTLPLGFDC